MFRGTRFILTALAAVVIVTPFATAHAASHTSSDTPRVRYIARSGSPTNIDRVVIKAACIGAEDSAAHLKLKSYGNGRAVYACARSGY